MRLEVIPVLHNVSSVQRVVDMARLSYSLGLDTLVVTKAYGGAAQSGVPEAMRLALKLGKSLVVLPELRDAVNLLSPSQVLAVTPRGPIGWWAPGARGAGGEGACGIQRWGAGVRPQRGRGAVRVYIEGVEGKVGPIAEAALILYFLLRGGGDGRG